MAIKTTIVLLVGLTLASVHLAEAQQAKKLPRIGILSPGFPGPSPLLDAFRQGLRELGYVEGQNIAIEYRFAENKPEALPGLAAELVRLKLDVILAINTPAVQAAKNATKTIPIVFTWVSFPASFVASLARPGGNITGLTTLSEDLSGKRLELLKEALPGISRMAVLWHSGNPNTIHQFREMERASLQLGIQLQPLEVRGPIELDSAFGAMTRDRAGALVVLPDGTFQNERRRIAALAAKGRLPTMYAWREAVDDGGLMAYGASVPDILRRAATYVDKILKGTKPADLPVEQPLKFELVINLKTAKQIGLTIPQSVLYRADKVIK